MTVKRDISIELLSVNYVSSLLIMDYDLIKHDKVMRIKNEIVYWLNERKHPLVTITQSGLQLKDWEYESLIGKLKAVDMGTVILVYK